MKYQPETLAIKAGEIVVWENHDLVPHTVTPFETEAIDAGKSFRYRFKTSTATARTIHYFCRFHPMMKGTIIVSP